MGLATARFRSDAFWSSAGTVVPIVAGAATTPFILDSLDADRFAVYALALAIVSFAPSFDFGVSRTAFRRIAATTAADASRVPAMSCDAMARARKAGFAAMALLTPALLSVMVYGSTGARITADVILPIMVALLTVPAAVVGNTQRAVLEGARRFDASAGVRIGFGLLIALVPALLCLLTSSVLVLTCSLLILRILATWYQARILRSEGLAAPAAGLSRTRDMAFVDNGISFRRESAWYAIAAPVSLLMSGFDRFVILALTALTLADLATFLAPQEIALRAIILPAAIVPALIVRIAPNDAAHDATRNLLVKVFLLVVGSSFIVCLALSLGAQRVAEVVFRSLPMDQVVPIIQVLCIGVFSNAVAQFPAAALNGRGMSNVPATLQLAELPLFVVALPYLVLTWGPIGAAIAWSSRIVIDTFLLLLTARTKTPTIAARRWHLLHVVGLAALTAPMLV